MSGYTIHKPRLTVLGIVTYNHLITNHIKIDLKITVTLLQELTLSNQHLPKIYYTILSCDMPPEQSTC